MKRSKTKVKSRQVHEFEGLTDRFLGRRHELFPHEGVEMGREPTLLAEDERVTSRMSEAIAKKGLTARLVGVEGWTERRYNDYVLSYGASPWNWIWEAQPGPVETI